MISSSNIVLRGREMFTGIITDVGEVRSIEKHGDMNIKINTRYNTAEIELGASIACSGACLTVVKKGDGWFAVEASADASTANQPSPFFTTVRQAPEHAIDAPNSISAVLYLVLILIFMSPCFSIDRTSPTSVIIPVNISLPRKTILLDEIIANTFYIMRFHANCILQTLYPQPGNCG